MTTEELIEVLKRYPGMRVIVRGYEAGYDDINTIKVLNIQADTPEADIYGSHRGEDQGWRLLDDVPLTPALLLDRDTED